MGTDPQFVKAQLERSDASEVMSSRTTERGASLVEFALVMPIIAFILFGIVDVGFGMQAREAVSLSLSDATRTGAVARQSPDADIQVLEAIADRLETAVGVEINRVVIDNADDILSEPSATCRAGTPETGCNVYDSITSLPGGCTGGWCPDDREADDLLGVWIDAEYTTVTDYSPFDLQWTDHAVVIVEPEIVE